MTGLVRKATLLAVAGLLAASAAMAHVPDPANSECPSPCIKVVGHDGTVGDPMGEYCITIRDFNNVPIENSSVVIDFSNCDIQLCVDQKDPDVIVDCVSMTVRKLTDVNGVACFRVIGKRRDTDCAAKPNPCVEVFADGVFICALYAPVFDLENEPGAGVSGNDLSRFLHLFLDCGVYLTAIDYNCNKEMDGDDLSQFLAGFFNGGSVLNCDPPKDVNLGPKCP
jgi:hypothetical protein